MLTFASGFSKKLLAAAAGCKRSMLLLLQSFEKRKPYIFDDQKKDFLHDFHLLQNCLFTVSSVPLSSPALKRFTEPPRLAPACKGNEMKGKRIDLFIDIVKHPVLLLGSFRFWLRASSSIMKMKSLFVPPEKHQEV